ncbi:MAG: LLM class oxidoreductase [Bacteroidota bacterium]
MNAFESINQGYNRVFKANQLTLGIVVPIENYAQHAVPSMKAHLERVQLIEQLGFVALWVRDVPLHVPSFGDAGQTFDPFTYLAYLAGQTSQIALGVASIALPLHHPIHVAKSAASIDQLSDGRLILGVASGDRFEEYPGMGLDYQQRGALFRSAFEYIRRAAEDFPHLDSEHYGVLNGQVDILPKPKGVKLPMLVTGHSRQSINWIAQHGDGWIYYPRNLYMQQHNISEWRSLIPAERKYGQPFMQPLYVDLQADDDFLPQPIHLGFRMGSKALIEYLHHLQSIGVNHVAINLRFNTHEIESSLERLATKVLPHFPTHLQKQTTS